MAHGLCGNSVPFLLAVFPPRGLSKGHWGFPTLCPSDGDPPCTLWKSPCFRRESAPSISSLEKSQPGSSGLFKGPALRGGAVPAIYRDRVSLIPSPAQSWSCPAGRWSPPWLPLSPPPRSPSPLAPIPGCYQFSLKQPGQSS